MIGELGKKFISNTYENGNYTRAYISLKCSPITDENMFDSSHVFYTNLEVHLSYKISKSVRKKECPFLLASDFFKESRFLIRLKGYEDLLEKAETDERVKFIVDFYEIKKMHFEFAEMNKGVIFPIGINYEKYYNKVKEVSGEESLNPFASETFSRINAMMMEEKVLDKRQRRDRNKPKSKKGMNTNEH